MELKIADKYEFADIIYPDMLRQFPQNELKEKFIFENLIESGRLSAFIIKDGRQNAGYISYLKTGDFIWLDYLAIFKEFHSRGLGAAALFELKENMSRTQSAKGCFLEVEKEDLELPDTIRRVKFYNRAGAFRLPCDYLYPNRTYALEMDLFYLPFLLDKPVKEQVQKTVRDIFSVLHADLPHAGQVYSEIVFRDSF